MTPFESKCKEILVGLDTTVFADMQDFLDSDRWYEQDIDFWRRSGGIRGILRRQQVTRLMVRIVELSVEDGRVTKEDAAAVIEMAATQSAYALRAIFEGFWAALLPHRLHINARFAFELCASAVARTHTLCYGTDTAAHLAPLATL